LSLAALVSLFSLSAPLATGQQPQRERQVRPTDRIRTGAEFLTNYRQITWYYDFATASELARKSGRPIFVVFCRASPIPDPESGKLRAAS